MNPKNFPTRVERRRKEAGERQAEAAKRSPEERLKRLDAFLGAGQGAKKERAKIMEKLNIQK